MLWAILAVMWLLGLLTSNTKNTGTISWFFRIKTVAMFNERFELRAWREKLCVYYVY